MSNLVTSGATLTCSFGTTPSQLTVLPAAMTNAGSMPAATIMDHQPMSNVLPFGMCSSMANPQVAAATAAAQGVLTPQPCIPNTVSPWVPGSPTVFIGGKPALNDSCSLMCLWAGQISVTAPGQFTVTVP